MSRRRNELAASAKLPVATASRMASAAGVDRPSWAGPSLPEPKTVNG
jgi:hypothetical protein